MVIILGVVLLLLVSPAAAATVTCVNGPSDTETIQAALDRGGEVVLEGPACQLTAPLYPRSHTLLRGMIDLHVTHTDYALILRDVAEVRLRDFTVHTNGAGILLSGAWTTRIDSVKLNTYGGTALRLMDGAGLWLRDVHTNGRPGGGTHAILLTGWWDTLIVTGFISEEHDGGFRITPDHSRGAWNLLLNQVVLDRLRPGWVGIHVEPTAGSGVGNIQAIGIWTAGSHGMVFNGADGSIVGVDLTNWRAGDSPYCVWTWRDVRALSASQVRCP